MDILITYNNLGQMVTDYTPCTTIPFGLKLLQDKYKQEQFKFVMEHASDFEVFAITDIDEKNPLKSEPKVISVSQLNHVIDTPVTL